MPAIAVGTDFQEPSPGYLNQNATHRRAVLHHYFTRSAEDFQAKQARGDVARNPPRPASFFYEAQAGANETCVEGVRMATALQANFGPLLAAPGAVA